MMIGDHMLELRELHGPYGNLWVEYLRATPDQRKLDYIPEWFLIQLAKCRLVEAENRIEELMPPARLPIEETERETRVEFQGAIGALKRIRHFIDYGTQADPVDARRRVLAALLGAEPSSG